MCFACAWCEPMEMFEKWSFIFYEDIEKFTLLQVSDKDCLSKLETTLRKGEVSPEFWNFVYGLDLCLFSAASENKNSNYIHKSYSLNFWIPRGSAAKHEICLQATNPIVVSSCRDDFKMIKIIGSLRETFLILHIYFVFVFKYDICLFDQNYLNPILSRSKLNKRHSYF